MATIKSKKVKGEYNGTTGDIHIEIFEKTYEKGVYNVNYTGTGVFRTTKQYKKDLTMAEAIEAYQELEQLIKL